MVTPTVLPVGINFSYNPATIALNSVSDSYSINVTEDVLTNGDGGTTIPEIDDCVNLTWDIDANMPGSSNYNMTVQWDVAQEGTSFDRSQSAIGEYYGGQWNHNPNQGRLHL